MRNRGLTPNRFFTFKNISFILLSFIFWFSLLTFFFYGVDRPASLSAQDLLDKETDLKRREEKLQMRELAIIKKEEYLVREFGAEVIKKLEDSQFGRGVAKLREDGILADKQKQEAVKEAFLFSWNSYKNSAAWGHDELKPKSGGIQTWMELGLTIVDSIDTLWIMGLKEEFKLARDWIDANLDVNKDRDVSLFETCIRVLGGLLSAYDLSKDEMFLLKARQLGDRFLPAFDTPSGIPYASVNLRTGRGSTPGWLGSSSVLAEIATLQLEFEYLSHHTGNPKYSEKALRVFDVLHDANENQKIKGLYPIYLNVQTGRFGNRHITLGAMGDSFYEYLLKYWLMTGKKAEKYRNMYDESVEAIRSHLIKKSSPKGLTYIAELINDQIVPKMDHLVCFAGGMFGLGSQKNNDQEQLELGKQITRTCHEMYNRTATGIAPELVRFEGENDFLIPSNAKHYLLRPETAESFFVMYRLTKDPIYREWGWNIFTHINRYCRTPGGFSGIRDVTTTTVEHDDLQQSFFMAETLKYLYLLFSEESLIPLDKYVFNTEAHPLGIFDS
eukprot:TRINITY_DN5228_c0_g1_i1.p1 TRINITY_DN5228_c0_g1~~TRINITY_DN5228_c0_g1_i1.p1  ORF type:complete len:557 (+),score=113.11 TRINITY_DN5228_c0_g1_i1:81-1751(+)